MNFKGKNGPLLIAEIGGNHEGDFEYAKDLTYMAIETNVDFIKFQIYSGDTLVSPLEDKKRNNHFKKFELSFDQHQQLIEIILKNKKKYTASVWDKQFINQFDKYIPIYKIGSGDLTAYPILKHIAEKSKPIILSTGLANMAEILNSIEFIQSIDKKYENPENLAILQCTSMYPIRFSDANLNTIISLKNETNLTIGYSDHTVGIEALKYAYAMGAEILEFHFTDRKANREFRDHQVSLTKNDVDKLTNEINLINQLKGSFEKKPTTIELENNHHISFRRGIYANKPISKGEIFTEKNLTILRPVKSIGAENFYDLIGKKSKKDFKKFEKITK